MKTIRKIISYTIGFPFLVFITLVVFIEWFLWCIVDPRENWNNFIETMKYSVWDSYFKD